MSNQPIRILVIEGNSEEARQLRALLAEVPSLDCRWTHVDRLNLALERLRTDPFDVVLLNLSLPDSQGLETFTRLQPHATCLPVVVTGHDDEATAQQAMQAGAQDYLVQGRVDGELLARTLRSSIERKRIEAALRTNEEHYRSLFENMLEGYAYCQILSDHGKPNDFVYLNVNKAFEKLTGLKDVVGKKVSEVIPGIQESNPELFEIYGRVATTGAPERFETYIESLGIWFSVSVYSPSQGYFTAVFDNITERKRAEEALRENERRLSSIYNTVADVIFHLAVENDGRYRFISVNSAFLSVTGLDHDQVVGKRVDEVIPEPSLTLVLAKYGQAIREKRIVRWEEATDYPTGRLTGAVSVAPVLDDAGNCTHLVGAVHDITERKRAEEALKRAEGKYRSIFENSVEGIFQTSPTGHYLTANPALALNLGYDSPEELIASVSDLSRQFYVDPKRREEFRRELEDRDTISDFESEVYRKDGSTLWVSENARAVRGDDGTLLYYEGSTVDITARKRAEEALAASEKRFRSLIENSSDEISIIAADSTLLYESPTSNPTLGYPRGEFLGQSLFQLIHPDDLERIQNQLARLLENADLHPRDQFRLRHRDGTWRWVEAVGTNLLSEPSVRGIVVNYHDISERKQAELQLADAFAFIDNILRASPVGILTYKFTGECLSANEYAARLVGATVEQLRNQNFRTLESWKHSGLYELAEKTIATGNLQIADVHVITSFGKELWLTAQFLAFKSGAEDHLLLTVGDITERKQAEEQLRLSAEILQRVSSLIVVADSQSQITYVSPHVRAVLGYEATDLLGDKWWDLTRNDPAEQERERDYVGRAARGEAPILETPYERMMVGRDGQPHWIVWQDAKGPGSLLIGVGHDITERKRAEEMLRQSSDELARLYRATAPLLAPGDDLVTVASEIVQTITQDFEVADCSVLLVNSAKNELERIARAGNYDVTTASALSLSGTGLTVAAFHAGDIVYAPEVHADARYVQGDPRTRSELVVPLRSAGSVIGLLDLQSPEPAAFDEQARRVVAAYAEHAALALQNARLHDMTRQRLEELESISKISAALRAAQTLDEMLPVLLSETIAIFQAERGSIWLYDRASDQLRMAVEHGWGTEPVPPLRRGEGIPGHVFATGQPYVSNDVKANPLRPESARARIPEALTGVCVPIRAAAEVIGAVMIQARLPRVMTASDARLLTTLAEIAGNAIHRSRLHAQTEKQLQRLTGLRAIDQTITSSFDMHLTLNILLEQITSQLHVDAADFLLNNPHSQTLEFVAGRGFRSKTVERSRLRVGEGLAGRVALERRVIQIPDLSEAGSGWLRAEQLTGERFRAYIGAPLIAKGLVKGVLEVFHRAPLSPDPEWIDFLETLAGQAAIAVDSGQLFEGLERSNMELALAYDSTLEGWSHALDLRDKETEGHTRRVTETTLRLARAMGMGDEELMHVRRGALLHDIGKMGVPDSILLKPGPLTDEEWEIMRRHPSYAYDMLAPINYLRRALDIPHCHHEKWDGTGYPRGLKGEQIPLAARMFAVVDVWDALRSDRPYRRAWPEIQVHEHIREQSGIHFDPQVVPTFLSII